MNEIDALDLKAFEELINNLEVIFAHSVTNHPNIGYVKLLTYSLWKNDEKLLMHALDGEDINPWDIGFVQHGLGNESPDMQSMIEFAARQKSWACVAELVQHYEDCRQGAIVHAILGDVVFEYENATDPGRIEYLESMMGAINAGHAKHKAAHVSHDKLFSPGYPSAFPKAARFIFKNFASIKFSSPDIGAIANKRWDLRQRVFEAIADGDCGLLESVLESMNANAQAFQAAKRAPHDGLDQVELIAFTAAAMACDFPHCVNAIFSKAVKFKKAQIKEKLGGKKAKDKKFNVLAISTLSSLLDTFFVVASTIDSECVKAKSTPSALIQVEMEKMLFSWLSEDGNRQHIDLVKIQSRKVLTAMSECVEKACAHAESYIQKKEIAEVVANNDMPVSMPRERVRL